MAGAAAGDRGAGRGKAHAVARAGVSAKSTRVREL